MDRAIFTQSNKLEMMIGWEKNKVQNDYHYFLFDFDLLLSYSLLCSLDYWLYIPWLINLFWYSILRSLPSIILFTITVDCELNLLSSCFKFFYNIWGGSVGTASLTVFFFSITSIVLGFVSKLVSLRWKCSAFLESIVA